MPGALIVLYSASGPTPLLTTTNDRGEFEFDGLPSDRYTPIASLVGYQEHVHLPIVLGSDEKIRIKITLQLAYAEEIFIAESLSATDESEPQIMQVITGRILQLLPMKNDHYTEALPLVPGVVRGPDGRLNFNGTRASQSLLLVNGSNATDPLTGEFSFELPLKAIDSVDVHTIPYSAEYGRFTAAVAEIKTRAGRDEWDVDFAGLWPSIRFRDGKIAGIRSATPQFQVSGPIKKGRAWFSQGIGFRFVRSRVYDMPSGADEQILTNFDTFTQFDVRLSDSHALTSTFSYFPVEVENLGLDSLHLEDATPDFESRGWNFAVTEKATVSSHTFIETSFAIKNFDVTVRPKSSGAMLLTPSAASGNYFNELDRESLRWDLDFVCTHLLARWNGQHVLKFGGNLSRTSFDGTDGSGRTEVLGADGGLLETIEFRGDPRIGADDLEISGFLQDQWRPLSRVGFDLGLRFDYERITGDAHLSPRIAWSIGLRADGSTVLKGGLGAFFGQLPLHAGSFEDFQERVETFYDSDGRPRGSPLVFENRVSSDGLRLPKSTAWNIELNQTIGQDWAFRINFRERRGSKELIVDRVTADPEAPLLVLSSRGESKTREFDVTARRRFAKGGRLIFSYTKSRTTGDLNNFSEVYKDLREPILLESEDSLQPFDVPHRFLLWGVLELPWKLTVVPGFEWRQGFPYTLFTEDYSVVGERNRGGRFPKFFSIDLRVTKEIEVLGRRARVGFQMYNITNHFNPRDFQNNLASPDFGVFANSRRISAGLRLQVMF